MLFDPDFDWELFPRPEDRPRRGLLRAAVVAAIVAMWFVDRPFAVVAACVAAAYGDVREGFRLAKVVPDPAGARVCMLFRFAWGAWKAGAMGLAFLFVVFQWTAFARRPGLPPESSMAMGALVLGFLASAALTAAGMIAALRSGLRVWIGEGVNQARMLLLSMLMSAFLIGVLIPGAIWLRRITNSMLPDASTIALVSLLAFCGLTIVGPIAILITLDRISRRVIAERPGKFGPKVPSVGKWNA
ncbi:hypothetical protein [Paludisphaera sp.]|uniref:hypothetical protein n=1 Tax=Paludisphaera sp. TaxID=2017432 RepID=UPI00301E3E62